MFIDILCTESKFITWINFEKEHNSNRNGLLISEGHFPTFYNLNILNTVNRVNLYP